MSYYYPYYVMWAIMLCMVLPLFFVLFFKTKSSFRGKPNILVSLIGLLFLSLASIGLYYYLGHPQALKEKLSFDAVDQTLVTLHQQEHLSKEKVLQTFRELEASLDKTELVWLRLADLYQALQLFEQAEVAYQQALRFRPDHEPYEMQRIYCQVMHQDGRVNTQALRALNSLLDNNPSHKGALNLLALHAFQNEEYAQAKEYWLTMLQQSADLTQSEHDAVMAAIHKTNEYLGFTNQFEMHIHLSISDELQSKLNALPPQAVLFVIAKESTKSGPPLAVIKRPITSFPSEVVLTDKDVMLQDVILDKWPDIVITARISLSGEPLPQRGDLVGQSEVLALQEHVSTQVQISKRHELESPLFVSSND